MAKVTDGASIRVDNMNVLRRELKAFGNGVDKEFNREMRGVAGIVASKTQVSIPTKTGKTARSVRPSFAAGYAQVRAGGTKAPGYAWLDFGGELKPSGDRKNTISRERIKGGRYVFPAVKSVREKVRVAARHAIDAAKRRAGLQ